MLSSSESSKKTTATPGVKDHADAAEEITKHIAELKREAIGKKKEETFETAERKEEMHRYRPLAATGNFMALDRADVQFAVKEIARS